MMEPMYLSIKQKETGTHIKKLLMANGYTVKDVHSCEDVLCRKRPHSAQEFCKRKKEQRAYHAKQRMTWGVLNPVTRSVPSGKTYNRNKDKQERQRISSRSGEVWC